MNNEPVSTTICNLLDPGTFWVHILLWPVFISFFFLIAEVGKYLNVNMSVYGLNDDTLKNSSLLLLSFLFPFFMLRRISIDFDSYFIGLNIASSSFIYLSI